MLRGTTKKNKKFNINKQRIKNFFSLKKREGLTTRCHLTHTKLTVIKKMENGKVVARM